MEKYFLKTPKQKLEDFNVTKDGLLAERVEQAIESFGYNELKEKRKK